MVKSKLTKKKLAYSKLKKGVLVSLKVIQQ